MATEYSQQVKEYGFTPVPADVNKLFDQAGLKDKHPPPPIKVDSLPFPDTALAHRISEFGKAHLPTVTYNHSMRVYYYGLAMRRYLFPDWEFTDETFFLTCVLHDIGTKPENLRDTGLSFEFYGGFVALNVLQTDRAHGRNAVCPRAQAESVAEAIIRHQDVCRLGNTTAVGHLLQLATLFDNIGANSELLHDDTVRDVTDKFPRLKWSSCFADTIREESRLKPWCHSSVLGDDFPAKILSNPYNAEVE